MEVEGVADDDALDTVLAVQHALLPARDRPFPLTLDLPHDYVAWRRALLEARELGPAPPTGRTPWRRSGRPGPGR